MFRRQIWQTIQFASITGMSYSMFKYQNLKAKSDEPKSSFQPLFMQQRLAHADKNDTFKKETVDSI